MSRPPFFAVARASNRVSPSTASDTLEALKWREANGIPSLSGDVALDYCVMLRAEVRDTLREQQRMECGKEKPLKALAIQRDPAPQRPDADRSKAWRLYNWFMEMPILQRSILWVGVILLGVLWEWLTDPVATAFYAIGGVVFGAGPERRLRESLGKPTRSGRSYSVFRGAYSLIGALLAIYWGWQLLATAVDGATGKLAGLGEDKLATRAWENAVLALGAGVALLCVAGVALNFYLKTKLAEHRLHLALGVCLPVREREYVLPSHGRARGAPSHRFDAGEGSESSTVAGDCCSVVSKTLASRWDAAQVSKVLPRAFLGLSSRPRGGRSERVVYAMFLAPTSGGSGDASSGKGVLDVVELRARTAYVHTTNEFPESVLTCLAAIKCHHKAAMLDKEWARTTAKNWKARGARSQAGGQDSFASFLIAQHDRHDHISLAGVVFADGKMRATNVLGACRAFDHDYARRAMRTAERHWEPELDSWFDHQGAVACAVRSSEEGVTHGVLLVIRNTMGPSFDLHDRLYLVGQAQRLGELMDKASPTGNAKKGVMT